MTDADNKLIMAWAAYCDEYDITIKSVGMAQLMIESSHAKSDLYINNNNPFGIKYTEAADYKVDYSTYEYINGERVELVASFAGYNSLTRCFNDYCRIVKPEDILTYDDYINHLEAIGYATDPSYINLINDVVRDYDLRDFDIPGSDDLSRLRSLYKEYRDELDRIAISVIEGNYGNGLERRERLGDMYNIIQDRVNEILA